MLNAGVVQQVGSPIELYQRPANLFVAGFIGSPKMNFVPVTIESVGAGTVTIVGKDMSPITVPAQTSGLQPGDEVTLGIRPHALVVSPDGPLSGTVQLIEQLGNETVVRVRLKASEVTVVLPGQGNFAVGSPISLGFALADIHLFNADKERVRRPS